MKKGKLIGLSVSFCIKDIIEGKVHANDVDYIIGATAASDEADWRKVADLYCKTYWRKNPKVARAILEGFLWQGKIKQPRLIGKDPHNIHNEHWMTVEP